ncbi:hypothetical protein BDN72DRAFT_431499 [Pluteus cervinus]|uniref:Uncharacterized protein n=1 Tax=Pluteus cervinus TaxID=181527 RepID=A0ACD3A7S0_9AGAR|nr:hypothetical protein BDN72DRAFT_431499 [Pluteus cervinus]
MPAKYSHVKKRQQPQGSKKQQQNQPGHHHKDGHGNHKRYPANPLVDKSINQAMTAVSQLERAIARLILLRYEQDIARLYSTRLYSIALVHLPTFVLRCISLGGAGWLAWSHDSEEVKDFFRAAITMDMRQAGERVATKSVLWSYTALRHFAMSNNVPICGKRGLHSLRLLPFFPALQAHLDTLEALPTPTFAKPPHLGSLQEGQEALEDACSLRYGRISDKSTSSDWDPEWREKVRVGYERLSQTLWKVAKEFDVRGYGTVLREKLTNKWCDCGCSTDHLGEVCERTVQEDEQGKNVRLGKEREWDGRGSGVLGWETEEEEDIWDVALDFGAVDPGEVDDKELTIGETMEWRYLEAEREKERGNAAFRKGDYQLAIKCYELAFEIEPELPHYQLNLAAAHLKLNNWLEAETACTKALGQHRSSKGYFRRAKARRGLNKTDDAIKDLRSVLKIQPTNVDALAELASLIPLEPVEAPSASSSSKSPDHTQTQAELLERLGVPRPRRLKPLPFKKNLTDERKLKIVLVAPSATDMSDFCNGCNHPHHNFGLGNLGLGLAGLANLAGKKKGKVRPKTEKSKELDKMRMESQNYPSWDRYFIKKVD